MCSKNEFELEMYLRGTAHYSVMMVVVLLLMIRITIMMKSWLGHDTALRML